MADQHPQDRELLELAAKAMGARPLRRTMGSEWPEGLLLEGIQRPWNPLADDGDALRLAVKLRLNFSDSSLWMEHNDQVHYDPHAATRRVIVRAAAAIGKATCD